MRTGETITGGQIIPEGEVHRGQDGRGFRVREATTKRQGSRRRGGEAELPEKSFRVRPGGTLVLRPPHWDNLPPPPISVKQEDANDHYLAADANRGED
jgi:hypothetical protein